MPRINFGYKLAKRYSTSAGARVSYNNARYCCNRRSTITTLRQVRRNGGNGQPPIWHFVKQRYLLYGIQAEAMALTKNRFVNASGQ